MCTRALHKTKYWSCSHPILQRSVPLLHSPAAHACVGVPQESPTHQSSPIPAQSRMYSLCASPSVVLQLDMITH